MIISALIAGGSSILGSQLAKPGYQQQNAQAPPLQGNPNPVMIQSPYKPGGGGGMGGSMPLSRLMQSQSGSGMERGK